MDTHLQETYKGRVTLSVEVIRLLIAINGGAAVAVLTFWGNAPNAATMALKSALLTFGVGVALGALTAVIGYIGQSRLYEERLAELEKKPYRRTHHYYIGVAVVVALASIVTFITACTWAANALVGLA